MSESTYSVGRRVYRGGSNAPTRGTVDPMGYIEREMNKPSDRRSGLAAAALRRLQGAQSGPGAPQDAPPGGAPGGGVPGQQPQMPGMELNDPAAMGGVPIGQPLIITATGKLQLNPRLVAAMNTPPPDQMGAPPMQDQNPLAGLMSQMQQMGGMPNG